MIEICFDKKIELTRRFWLTIGRKSREIHVISHKVSSSSLSDKEITDVSNSKLLKRNGNDTIKIMEMIHLKAVNELSFCNGCNEKLRDCYSAHKGLY